jgi:preprotein translocase subunit SecG
MLYVLVPIYVIVCVFLILVVLLQQGKGADVASAFGASSSQTTFGSRGTTTVLERVTTWSFVAFSLLAVTISLIEKGNSKKTVMGSAPKGASVPAAPRPPVPAAPAPAAPVPAAPVPAAPAPAAPAPAGK